MALIKQPAGTQMSGRIGGTVYSRNKSGAYTRTTNTTGASTPARSGIQSLFSFLSKLWQTVTQAQQDAWAFDATLRPMVNRLGVTFFLSGFNLFMRNNMMLLTGGFGENVNRPGPVPTFANVTFNVSGSDARYDLSSAPVGNTLVLDFNDLSGAENYKLWGTMVFGTGINNPGARYRLIGVYDDTTLLTDKYADYKAIFGDYPAPPTGTVAAGVTYGRMFFYVEAFYANGDSKVGQWFSFPLKTAL